MPAAHHLQAMTSQQRWNDIENQVSHYLRPMIYSGLPPHSTTVHILKYTIEIVPAAHHLQAMTSQQRRNDVENQVSRYLRLDYLFGAPTP